MANKFAKLLLVAAIFILVAGCDRKSCKDVSCPAGEECSSGSCICQDGYEGTDCATYSYLKYLGTYYVSETCNNATPPFNWTGYTVTVLQDPTNVDVIHFEGFFNGQMDMIAYIYNVPNNLGNNLSIPGNQGQGGIQISTSQGTLYNNTQGVATIQLSLNYTDQNGAYGCTELLTKQ